MKKQLLASLLWACSLGLFAQYQIHHYYNVPSSELGDFVQKETTYWSKYHKNAIDKGYLSGWGMYQILGNSTAPSALGNLVFVKNYTSLSQIANMMQMYSDPSLMEGMDATAEDMANPDYSVGMYIVKAEADIGTPGEVYVVNFGTPKDLSAFVEENKSLWQPLFEKAIANNSGLTSWGVRTTIYPLGSNTHHTVMTYDGYASLEHALKALENAYILEGIDTTILEKSQMSTIAPDGFSDIVIYQLLSMVN